MMSLSRTLSSPIIETPVKRLHIATRKSPCGSGTETYEK